MIAIISHENMQYQIHSGIDIDIPKEWETVTQGPAYYIDSKTFPYRRLLKLRDVFVLDNSHLTGFQKRFDEYRDYHALLRIFLIHLRQEFNVTDFIFATQDVCKS